MILLRSILFNFSWLLKYLVILLLWNWLKIYFLPMVVLVNNSSYLNILLSDFGLDIHVTTNSNLGYRSYQIGISHSILGPRSYQIGISHSILGPRSYWNGEKCFWHHVSIEGFGYFVQYNSIKEKCNVFMLQGTAQFSMNIYSLSSIHYIMQSFKVKWMFLNVGDLANMNFLSCHLCFEKIIVIRSGRGQDLAKSCLPCSYVL